MAITELALLHLKSTTTTTTTTIPDPTRSTPPALLLSAAKAQADYSSFPVHLLTQIEDPSYIYLLGGWKSTSHHLDEWIPGPTNQVLLQTLKDEVDVVWMIHVDVEPYCSLVKGGQGPTTTTSSSTSNNNERIPLDAPVVAIGRYFIAPNQKDAFLGTFRITKNHLKMSIVPRTLDGGLRLDPKETTDDGHEKEEFVLFSGWQEMRDCLRFAESEGFKEFGKIREFLNGDEVKHAVVW